MLVGLVDPSYEEREKDEPGRYPNWFSPEELLAVAARQGPEWSPWSYEMIQAAINANQERDYISTSMLTSACMRSSIIERREDYIDNVDDLYAPLRGTQVHSVLENAARPNSLAEARFFTTVKVQGLKEPLELSCSPDIVTWDPDGLGDYKVTERDPGRYPWKSHSNQVTWNAYIVRNAERWERDGEPFDIPFNPHLWKPEHLYLVYLLPKKVMQMEVKKTIDVPHPTHPGKFVRRAMPYIADDATVEEEMFPRIKAIQQALDAYPEWPWDEGDPPFGFDGPAGWKCPGPPLCYLPNCLAKRWPHHLTWKRRDG